MSSPTRPKTEFRYVELRAEGEELSGTVVRYGEWNEIGGSRGFRELVKPRALQFDDVIVNLMHDRSKPVVRSGTSHMELRDSDEALELRFSLPDTVYGREAKELVNNGLLRGLSVEMNVERDNWEGRNRTIEDAKLHGIGIVDRPAYSSSTLNRAQMPMQESAEYRFEERQRRVLAGSLEWGKVGVVSVQRRQAVRFEPGSLELSDSIVLLHGLDYNQVLANSGANGALRVSVGDDGVRWTASRFARTQTGRDVRTLVNARLITGWKAGFMRRSVEMEKVKIGGIEYDLEVVRDAIMCEIYLTSDGMGGSGPVRRSRLV